MEDEHQGLINNDATKRCEISSQNDTSWMIINDETHEFENFKQVLTELTLELKSAVWSNEATVALLKLYDEKLEMMVTPKKKTRIWAAISESLKPFNIEVTPDQVRWKINALTKKHKQCIDLGQHEKFQYFKEMNNIYSQCHVADDANTVAELLQLKNNRLNNQFKTEGDNKVSFKPCKESKALIKLRKMRLANRIESERSKSKLELEKQWLEYLKRQEEQRALRDEVIERDLKIKEKELEVHKKSLNVKESLEYLTMQMWERKHKTLLSIEREKFEMLKKMLSLNK